MNKPKIQITFDDSFFEFFDGSQEELDDIISHVTDLVTSSHSLDNTTVNSLDTPTDFTINHPSNRTLH